MGRKKEACAGCLQKCLQIHGKNKNSSTITSFFKVMIGDQFTKILYLPPKFAAKMSKSIEQTTFLEDAQGRQWKVSTTSVNGTLAFEKGWSTFSSDHDLQVGDFLVFTFIIGSHFFVKIFDKSACEKEASPRNKIPKKRTRSVHFDVEVESRSEHDNDSMNRLGSSRATVSGSDIEKSPLFRENDEHHMNRSAKKPMRSEKNKGPKPVCMDGLQEELCYMINRGIDYEREGEKSRTANLFDLEMEKNSSRTIAIVGAVLDESLHHQLLAPSRTQIDENTSIRSGIGSQPIAENESKKGLIKNNIASEDVDIKISINDKDLSIPPAIEYKGCAQESREVGEVMKFQIDEVKGNLVSTPSRNNPLEVYRKEHSSFITTDTHNIIPEFNLFSFPNPIQAHNFQHGEMGKIIKKERVEMTPGEMGKIIKKERVEMTPSEMGKIIKKERVEVTPVGVWKTIKEELDDMTPGLFEDEENLNIMVNCQNPFTLEREDNEVDKDIGLEVKNSLPAGAIVSCIVAENRSFLELPLPLSGLEMRWERKIVFLRDSMERMWPVLYRETADFNVLTSGWEAFCRANDIQPGQECVFKAEKECEGRYQVSIRRNS